jgi:hypothetical protein
VLNVVDRDELGDEIDWASELCSSVSIGECTAEVYQSRALNTTSAMIVTRKLLVEHEHISICSMSSKATSFRKMTAWTLDESRRLGLVD